MDTIGSSPPMTVEQARLLSHRLSNVLQIALGQAEMLADASSRARDGDQVEQAANRLIDQLCAAGVVVSELQSAISNVQAPVGSGGRPREN